MNSRTRLAWHAGDPVLPLAPDEVRVWVATVADHGDPRLLAGFRKLLSSQELQRLERLATAALRQEFLVTRALCRQALSLHTGVPPADWSFQVNAFGCPAVLAPAAERTLRFNLSNTRSMVVCAVAQTVDLGVDVECWNRPGDVVPIGVQVFSDDERRALQGCGPALQRRRFYQYWTLKEAYVKGRGMGMSLPMQAVSVDPKSMPLRVLLGHELNDDNACWQFEQIELECQHVLALAVRRGSRLPFRVVVRKAVLGGSPALPQTEPVPKFIAPMAHSSQVGL